MSIVSSIAQIGTLAGTVRDIVSAFKSQPKQRAQTPQAGNGVQRPARDFESVLAHVTRVNTRFVELRDVDGNGQLNPIELGVDEDLFAALDKDRNGEISVAELNQYYLENQTGVPGTELSVST